MERGEDVHVPSRDLSEPVFQHGAGGRRSVVHPGNKEFVAGDRIARPDGGSGGGSGEGEAADSGEGEDDFVFQLTREEFLEYLFDDLALPNLTKRHLKGNVSFKYERAGYSTDGVPTKLSVLRSLQSAKARRIALGGRTRRTLRELEQRLTDADAAGDEFNTYRLREEAEQLRARLKRIPFLDTTDLRYNLHLKRPVPTSQAVMFCLMDVSGSMDQETKDMAKRFYLLLYMFLKRHYERTEIVFIRHHTTAKEVSEQDFFYSRETGGTVVSSALKLMQEIIEERYSTDAWNIYGAQASDGDNWSDDSPVCAKLLQEKLLPLVQYFAYMRDHQAQSSGPLAGISELSRRRIRKPSRCATDQSPADIFPVFHDLFQTEGCGMRTQAPCSRAATGTSS